MYRPPATSPADPSTLPSVAESIAPKPWCPTASNAPLPVTITIPLRMQLWTDPGALVPAPALGPGCSAWLGRCQPAPVAGCPRSVGFETGCLGSAPFDCAALAQPTF